MNAAIPVIRIELDENHLEKIREKIAERLEVEKEFENKYLPSITGENSLSRIFNNYTGILLEVLSKNDSFVALSAGPWKSGIQENRYFRAESDDIYIDLRGVMLELSEGEELLIIRIDKKVSNSFIKKLYSRNEKNIYRHLLEPASERSLWLSRVLYFETTICLSDGIRYELWYGNNSRSLFLRFVLRKKDNYSLKAEDIVKWIAESTENMKKLYMELEEMFGSHRGYRSR